jgi:hypothetical protein
MQNLCRKCFTPLREGQLASAVVTATYHSLKSQIAYALDPADMVADPETLIHGQREDCQFEDFED